MAVPTRAADRLLTGRFAISLPAAAVAPDGITSHGFLREEQCRRWQQAGRHWVMR